MNMIIIALMYLGLISSPDQVSDALINQYQEEVEYTLTTESAEFDIFVNENIEF